MLNCQLCCLYAAGGGENKQTKSKEQHIGKTYHKEEEQEKKKKRRRAGYIEEKLGERELEGEVSSLTQPSRESFFPIKQHGRKDHCEIYPKLSLALLSVLEISP